MILTPDSSRDANKAVLEPPAPANSGAGARANVLGADQFADRHAERGQKATSTQAKTGHRAQLAPVVETDSAQYSGLVAWGFCYLSLLGLQLNQSYGAKAILLFLVPWVFLCARRIPNLVSAIFKDHLLLLSPIFATLSALWSNDPPWSLRAGVQYGVTIVIGIAAANLIKREVVLSSMMAALATVTGMSLILGFHQGGFAAMHGIAGLYGSKNQFASSSAALLIGAVYQALYRHVSARQRLFIFGLVCTALAGIYFGHSAGTLVAIIGAAGFTIGIQLMRRSGVASVMMLTIGMFLAITLIIGVGAETIFSGTLQVLGKDSTLTGRTELWATAFKQIAENPLVGTGYQAFWRVGNPIAERLWAQFGITDKTGFSFHNEYVNTTVDLGLLGLMISLTILGATAFKSISSRLRGEETFESALHTMFFFYLFLTFIEPEFFYQFFLSPIILCLVWADRRREGLYPARIAPAASPILRS